MKIVAIIPARKGSKRIPNKNIKTYIDKPLIWWSIAVAKQSQYIDSIIVSTDCHKIKEIAIDSGAEVPFMRPGSISADLSTDYEFIEHYLSTLSEQDEPDLIVQLRPTYPNRKVEILDESIRLFIKNMDKYSSLRTVCELDKPAFKMYRMENDELVPLFPSVDSLVEPYNLPAQLLPKTYWHNGYIDIIKPETVRKWRSITGPKIFAFLMAPDEIDDIDTIEEWRLAEQKHRHSLSCQSG